MRRGSRSHRIDRMSFRLLSELQLDAVDFECY